MNKIEALRYFIKNCDGGEMHTISFLINIILEDKEVYTQDELDTLIDQANDY